jgi:hypothetical protein
MHTCFFIVNYLGLCGSLQALPFEQTISPKTTMVCNSSYRPSCPSLLLMISLLKYSQLCGIYGRLETATGSRGRHGRPGRFIMPWRPILTRQLWPPPLWTTPMGQQRKHCITLNLETPLPNSNTTVTSTELYNTYS